MRTEQNRREEKRRGAARADYLLWDGTRRIRRGAKRRQGSSEQRHASLSVSPLLVSSLQCGNALARCKHCTMELLLIALIAFASLSANSHSHSHSSGSGSARAAGTRGAARRGTRSSTRSWNAPGMCEAAVPRRAGRRGTHSTRLDSHWSAGCGCGCGCHSSGRSLSCHTALALALALALAAKTNEQCTVECRV